MFGNKKMYKKGLADAMQAYEGFSEKQKAALEQVRREVENGNKKLEDALSGLGDEITGIYDYLDAKERAALYHLSTPYDIKELDDSEQRLLLAVLYQLAEDEGIRLNDDQRTFIHGVQRYLGITNPQVGIDDLSVVGDIDSGSSQKAILQTVMEFFYLQDGDEISEEQEEFLDNFSVNKKQALAIENTVERLFNAVGAKGLSEKYGNDEVIQQAKDEMEAAFKAFEEKISSDWLHASGSGGIWISPDKNWSNISRSAYMESECYKDQSKCRTDAQRQLERYHREISKKMVSYTKRYGEDSIYKSLCDSLDYRVEDRKKELSKIRSAKTAAAISEIAQYLTKAKVVEEAAAICDQLAEKYRLPSSSNYNSEIEYETSDPSEYEDNIFAKAFAKGFKRYGYGINSAVDAVENDGRERLEYFAEDLTGKFNDLVDRYIIDPIQRLLPKLEDALYVPDEDN